MKQPPRDHTLLLQAMGTACYAIKCHRRWLKTDLASVLLSRLHTGCPASASTGSLQECSRQPSDCLNIHYSSTPRGFLDVLEGYRRAWFCIQPMGDTPTRAALLDCLASGLVRLLHGPTRAACCWALGAAPNSDRCRAPGLSALTSPAARSMPSRDRCANASR